MGITPLCYLIIYMQGGLFGLSNLQKTYLYTCQIIPTILVVFSQDLMWTFVMLQFFYVLSSLVYINYISLQKSVYPYVFYQFSKIKSQIQKGFTLAGSAYLLITIYGILILYIGKFVLPHRIELGQSTHQYWFILIIACITNPFLQEWYWRLFLPKTFQSTYYKSHVINVTYLMFHFVLFSEYLGFWRSVPFVSTFFSVGRSMSHITEKYGILSSIVTHYGITLAALTLFIYTRYFTSLII